MATADYSEGAILLVSHLKMAYIATVGMAPLDYTEVAYHVSFAFASADPIEKPHARKSRKLTFFNDH